MVRGIAILGILPVNAPFFAYPVRVGDDPDYPLDDRWSSLSVAVVRTFFEYKFITLFALLFGVGLGILHTRHATAGNDRYAPIVLRRLGALLVFGALHATCLWFGDIVFEYALIALVVCWFAYVAPRPLAVLGTCAGVLPLGLLCVGLVLSFTPDNPAADWLASEFPDGQGGRIDTGWREFVSRCDDLDPDFEIAVYGHGTYEQEVVLRTVTWVQGATSAAFYFWPRLAGLMLLGIALGRSRWFRDPGGVPGRARFRLIAAIGLPVGLAGELLGSWLRFEDGATSAQRVVAEMVHYSASACLSAGLLAGVALLCTRRALWQTPFAAVGRLAFTNYIGQSLVMSSLFYAHGRGLYDQVSRGELAALVCCVWGAQLALSVLWLRRFRSGPLEWLWRSATYWRPMPFLRRPDDGAVAGPA